MDPVFAFTLDLARGRVKGFDGYKVEQPIEYGHDLKPADFPITDDLYRALRDYVAARPYYRITSAQLDRERAFVERYLRYDLVTAAYGTVSALQVFNTDDPQIIRAVDLLPRARELAQADNVDVAWTASDMRSFTLPQPVDVIATLYDSLDCLLTNDEILDHFRRVGANLTPESISTNVTLTMEKLDSGWTITSSHLDVVGKVPGADAAAFQKYAEAAEKGCPVSKVLNAKISMTAKLG